jgi:UPF0755 protein
VFFSLLILLGVGILGGYLWWKSELSPVNRRDTAAETFTITSGQGVREIAAQLHSAGLIRNEWAFFLLVKQLGISNKLQAGEFHLSPSMNAREIVTQLQTGTFDIWVSIPEGKRAEEIADILQGQLSGFGEGWREQLVVHEGYLFPSKYRFAKDASLEQVLATMQQAFETNYAKIPVGRNSSLSQLEIVKIASLVEREAKFAEDRPLVASVILNRLQIGMGLQIDATIQYALGYQLGEHTWWKKHLSAEDLDLDSPYNTYTHTGLPPTPISNPGYEALAAVVDAPDTDYLYYISDSSGHNHYAKTLEEHNANIRKYGL